MRTIKNTTDTEIRRSFIDEFTYGDKDKAIRMLIQATCEDSRSDDSETSKLVYEITSGFNRLAKAISIVKQTSKRDC